MSLAGFARVAVRRLEPFLTWFFTGDGEPISETGGGHERDAALYILGRLARRAEEAAR
ncbi:hypothetical protein Acsp04_62630 [Actinomadura sp. NBRC 104425]|uniref:hypothetical protein n=1 Tax=Actinomadura sp. NBRC 104425 TaxID=3032204 RepID=UPI0024A304AD|nr:hypothetical protein [Actinomadura sp. NBRC 104425]GLZ16028.1 hypothetical protein Acsp04_62630 [Actinomadura sp. NBRC 104425]